MMKKCVTAGAVTGMLGWVAYSYAEMNKPLPSDEEWEAYGRSLMKTVGMEGLWGTWREEVLPLDGRDLRLYHFEAGPREPVVVFIPGTAVYALLYLEFMYKLSREGFNVVGFDPRGHGRSTGKRGSYTLTTQVDDTRAVIDHVTAVYNEMVAVSGSSQGGMVAFYTAAADPRVRAALCHNIIADDEPDNERITRWPRLYRHLIPVLPMLVRLADTPVGELRTPISAYLDLKKETSRLLPDIPRFLREDPLLVNAISLRALASLSTTPLARRVEEIETPMMVIHGGKDKIFPEDYVRRLYDRLTCEKEFLYLADAPHLVMTDNVEEVVPVASVWLKEKMW